MRVSDPHFDFVLYMGLGFCLSWQPCMVLFHKKGVPESLDALRVEAGLFKLDLTAGRTNRVCVSLTVPDVDLRRNRQHRFRPHPRRGTRVPRAQGGFGLSQCRTVYIQRFLNSSCRLLYVIPYRSAVASMGPYEIMSIGPYRPMYSHMSVGRIP